MNSTRTRLHSIGCTFALALLVILLGATTQGEEVLLRWKFKPGETLLYAFPQTTTTEAHVNGGDLKTSTVSRGEVSLMVVELAGAERAEARLSLERMQIDITAPQLALHYDSAGRQRPTGYMENVIAGYDALARRSFRTVIDGRGELLSVSLPAEEVQELTAEKLPLDNILTPKGLSQFLGLTWPRLPAKAVSPGDTWEEREEVVNMALGKVQSKRTYTFEGPMDRGGKQLDKISYVLELAADAKTQQGGVTFEVEQQESKGEVYLDRAAGHFVEGKSSMQLTLGTNTGSEQFELKLVITGGFVLVEAKAPGGK